jgi:hypothetical protein
LSEAAEIEQRLARLLDRAEIADLLGRYAYCIDTRDWTGLRACFAAEVEIDLEGIGGLRGDQWVEAVAAAFVGQPASQHLKLPVAYEFDGEDAATVVSLLQGKHWRPEGGAEGPLQTVVGYYRERLVRTAEGWRIASFAEQVLWNEGNEKIQERMTEQLLAALGRPE